MSRRIIIPDRIIIHERVTVLCHRPLRGRGHNRIRLREPAQRAVVPASVKEVDSKFCLFPLPGEVIVRAEAAKSIARLTEGFVQRGSGDRPCASRVVLWSLKTNSKIDH